MNLRDILDSWPVVEALFTYLDPASLRSLSGIMGSLVSDNGQSSTVVTERDELRSLRIIWIPTCTPDVTCTCSLYIAHQHLKVLLCLGTTTEICSVDILVIHRFRLFHITFLVKFNAFLFCFGIRDFACVSLSALQPPLK